MTGCQNIAVDETTTILIRDGEIIVDCDRPPRRRSKKLAQAVRDKVTRILIENPHLSVRRVRDHQFQPSGREHCISYHGENAPRVTLCLRCHQCRICCAQNRETHWWEEGEMEKYREYAREALLWRRELAANREAAERRAERIAIAMAAEEADIEDAAEAAAAMLKAAHPGEALARVTAETIVRGAAWWAVAENENQTLTMPPAQRQVTRRRMQHEIGVALSVNEVLLTAAAVGAVLAGKSCQRIEH